MNQRLEITITGQIQGVFFRQNTLNLAKKLKLTGWVKNEPDNSVEVLAEGDEVALKELLAFCQKSPGNAMVEQARESWSEATGEFKDFNIF